MPKNRKVEELTADEARVYDRQIRVWGIAAQQRLRQARVLVVGGGSLQEEVCKNLILAGVGALTLMNGSLKRFLKDGETANSFLVQDHQPGTPLMSAWVAGLQELNPNVEVTYNETPIQTKSTTFFKEFDVVLVSDCEPELLSMINKKCRMASNAIGFFCMVSIGFDAFFFCDMHIFDYVVTHKKDAEEMTQNCSRKFCEFRDMMGASPANVIKACGRRRTWAAASFLTIRLIFQLWDELKRLPTVEDLEKLQDMCASLVEHDRDTAPLLDERIIERILSAWNVDLAPVSSVAGGLLGQEVLKCLSKKDEPLGNCTVFSGLTGAAVTVNISNP